MSLDLFWQFIEARPTGAAVMAEWRERCGPALPAIAPVLEPTAHHATAHPAPKPGRPPLRVVRHRDGRLVGVCDQGRTERVDLSLDDVVLHAVSPGELRRRLCVALSIKTAHEPVGTLPGSMRLGHWEPRPALQIPVVLIASPDEATLLTALHAALAGAKKPPFVLTPCRSHWSEPVKAAADAARATLASLGEVVAADGAAWQAADAWQAFQFGHLERAGLATPAQIRAAKPKKKRESRAAAIDGLKRELREHLRSAKAHFHATAERGEPKLLPRPEQQDLAKRLGVSKATVTRCLNKEPDAELKLLWSGAENIDYVRKFRG